MQKQIGNLIEEIADFQDLSELREAIELIEEVASELDMESRDLLRTYLKSNPNSLAVAIEDYETESLSQARSIEEREQVKDFTYYQGIL